MAAADWSEMTPDLLWKIIELLPIVDYIRFGSVCNSWHTALAENRRPPPPELPWLLFPDISNSGTNTPIKTFSLRDDTFHHLNIPEDLCRLTCIGSSHGLLLFIDFSSPESKISLFDPISKTQHVLPSTATLPPTLTGTVFQYPHTSLKIVVSPYKSSGLMAFAIKVFTSSLAFAREGDNSWSILKPKPLPGLYAFVDIIFYRETIWGLTRTGCLVPWDMSDASHPRQVAVVQSPGSELKDPLSRSYLVESSGDLLLVWREFTEKSKSFIEQVWSEEIDREVETTDIKVFKMDHTDQLVRWAELKSLGDYALFLSNNPSLAISSLDFSELSKSCIYLTEDSGSNLLKYHVEDEDLEPLLSVSMSRTKHPPIFWFTPNFASEKVQKHERTCINNHHVFIPFAFDTFGIWAPEAVNLFKSIQKVMNNNGTTPGNVEYIFRRFGFAIQKGLAAQLVARLPSV